jgi:uncharacterized protein YkwD
MLAVPDKLAGAAVRCPQCAQVVKVRTQALEVPSALPPPPAPAASVPAGPRPLSPRRTLPNLGTPAAIVLGVVALPLAVAVGKPLIGIILLGIGLPLAVAGLVVCGARGGAGLGLGITAVAVCASGLYVAVKLPGPPSASASASAERREADKSPRPSEEAPPSHAKEKAAPHAEPVEESPNPVPPAKTDEQTAARALERLNMHRRNAGQPPVTLDEETSKGCKVHAAYLARNYDNPRTRALGPHKEDPNLEGYTPEGDQAGRNGAILSVKTNINPNKYDPSDVEAVDSLVSTFYHRLPLLHPDLRRVGFGWARHAQGKESVWVTVLDIRDSRRPKGLRDWVVFYPAADQADVPTTFLNNELPNPTPPEGAGKRLGYCVTVSFANGIKVEDAEASLAEGTGGPLAAWVTTPTRPGADPRLQQNTVCLIARAPLKPRTTYTATVTARVDGKDWKRSWKFTTGAE